MTNKTHTKTNTDPNKGVKASPWTLASKLNHDKADCPRILIGYSQYAASNQFHFELAVRICIHVHNSAALSLQPFCAETICLRVTENAKLEMRSTDRLVIILSYGARFPVPTKPPIRCTSRFLPWGVKRPGHEVAGYKWVELYLYYPCTSSR
jgi:hypothetical protein